MSRATYTVTFTGPVPEGLWVGQQLHLAGLATVRSIAADMVDITSLGKPPHSEFVLGEVQVALVANELEVTR
jgi:hypothetical protein